MQDFENQIEQALDLILNKDGVIPTMSENLDDMLGGGVQAGQVTELVGEAGTGKTQLCLQLAVCARLPPSLGGLAAQTVILDCEGKVVPSRLLDMARGVMDLPSEMREDFSPDSVMKGVFIRRCKNVADVVAAVDQLEVLVKEKPSVRLVVVDSIAWYFRYGWEDDYLARTGVLYRLAQGLQAVAGRGVAVVVTNHVTANVEEGGVMPALGEAWRSAVGTRLMLRYNGDGNKGERTVEVVKSPSLKSGCCVRISIGKVGIRDVQSQPESKRIKMDVGL